MPMASTYGQYGEPGADEFNNAYSAAQRQLQVFQVYPYETPRTDGDGVTPSEDPFYYNRKMGNGTTPSDT